MLNKRVLAVPKVGPNFTSAQFSVLPSLPLFLPFRCLRQSVSLSRGPVRPLQVCHGRDPTAARWKGPACLLQSQIGKQLSLQHAFIQPTPHVPPRNRSVPGRWDYPVPLCFWEEHEAWGPGRAVARTCISATAHCAAWPEGSGKSRTALHTTWLEEPNVWTFRAA